ncbi:MAG: flavin-containing monooxygenase [Planctomycetota bacterium]|jgi:hypothetical protein
MVETSVDAATDRYCVIGAGPAGLVAGKVFRERGVPYDCFEREDDVGGNWYFGRRSSSVYETTHLISSKAFTAFAGFPMPEDYPPYPGHRLVLKYIRAYADHFSLRSSIQFSTGVSSVKPDGAGGWLVALDDGSPARRYAGVVVANGHFQEPSIPEIPGEFSGRLLPAREYRNADTVRGKRVVVVGCGNSGSDIAVEAGRHAECAFLSVREGRYLMPKFMFGRPADEVGDWVFRFRLPRWLRALLSWYPMHLVNGPHELAGLPKPQHRMFERQPVMNSQLPLAIGHGLVKVKPPIAEFEGDCVRFSDGSREQVDVVIFATGYHIHMPFLEDELLEWHNGHPRLYLNILPEQHPGLFFAGLIEPRTRTFELIELQVELMARLIQLSPEDPRLNWFQAGMATRKGDVSRDSDDREQFLSIEYYDYRKRLEWLIRRLS